MFKQMSKYFEPFFSKLQCCFRKGLASSNVFCQCLRNRNRQFIIKKDLGHSLRIFPRAFDCLSHDLLIAKLSTDSLRFNIDSLRLVRDYLSNRK